jgi:CRISPR-associated protein Csa3
MSQKNGTVLLSRSSSQLGVMHTYIAPIGYDSTRVTRPVLSWGVTPDDKIILLQPTSENDDGRASEAVADVERFVSELEPSVTLEPVDLPYDDFHEGIITCTELIHQADGETVVVLGGGARDLFLALSTAALACRESVDTTLQYSDIDGQVREILLPNLTNGPSDSETQTLTAVKAANSGPSLSDLAEYTGSSKSTIARHVQSLEEQDLVATEHQGKAKVVQLTQLGEFHLSAFESPAV